MRVKRDRQLHLSFGCVAGPRIVDEFEEKYKRISDLLDENPKILDRVDRDLSENLGVSRKGRRSRYTSENILRALLVLRIEGLSYRDTVVRIADSILLHDFVRLGTRTVMDHTFLCRCFDAIGPETWEALVGLQVADAARAGRADPAQIRTDTTVVEADIHWPTDSSLLWDSWRVLVRLLRRARPYVPEIARHRFHRDKARRDYLFITRYIHSTSKSRRREVRRRMRRLIESVERVRGVAEKLAGSPALASEPKLAAMAEKLFEQIEIARAITEAARRAALSGEKVPASERLFSVHETHVELIKRGKSRHPVQFGHVVQLTQTRQKLITNYSVFENQPSDHDLLDETLEKHNVQFGAYPEVVTADGGFHPTQEEMDAIREKVPNVAVPQRVRDWADEALRIWKAFRAGIEGTISTLKRAFGLSRCLFRGFKHFASSVGLSVFCHNLVCLAGG